MTLSFDVKKYSKLQEAYSLLGKTTFAMDQLHMNFISAIHTTAFTVLREHSEQNADDKQKVLFEQMCEVSTYINIYLCVYEKMPKKYKYYNFYRIFRLKNIFRV